MSDMIERVARAICGADGDHCVWPDGCGCDYRARAAIAAMREPTEAMIAARYGDGLIDEPHCAIDAKTSWQAMIDAALAG